MNDLGAEAAGIAREARVLLERERRRGRRFLALETAPAPAVAPAPRAPAPRETPPAGASSAREAAPALATRPASRAEPPALTLSLPGFEPLVTPAFPPAVEPEIPGDLGGLERAVASCRKCSLCGTRTNTVFADGSDTAKLVFVGEAPGRDEDLKGLPFVGRAGQLLDKMIAAIALRRDEVYICNVLKCRPPENRTPLPDEVEKCMPYLERQLSLVKPALICALGLSAAQALLKTKASMASLRGRVFEYRGIPLIATYHPAALLRNPSLKREAWEDMQRVRDTLRARAAG